MSTKCKPSPVMRSKEKSTRPVHRTSADHAYAFIPKEVVWDQSREEPRRAPYSKICDTLMNRPEWKGVFRKNLLTSKLIAVNPPVKLALESGLQSTLEEADLGAVIHWLEFDKIAVSKDAHVTRAVLGAAAANAFHPIRDYFAYLPTAIAPTGAITDLARALGAANDLEVAYVRKTLIGAYRRIKKPGCKVDTMLVLKGETSFHKSQAIGALFNIDGDDESYVLDTKMSFDSTDFLQAVEGKWAVEIQELASVLKSDANTVKAVLSTSVDEYRKKYARGPAKQPRTFVFFGTTNDDEFLRDPTSNRRFWVLHVKKKIDLDWLRAVRDDIWAEVLYYADTVNEQHWLTDEEQEKSTSAMSDYEEKDPRTGLISDFLRGKVFVTVMEVYQHLSELQSKGVMSGVMSGETTSRAKKWIEATLRQLGCKHTNRRVSRGTPCLWEVPDALRDAKVAFSKHGATGTSSN